MENGTLAWKKICDINEYGLSSFGCDTWNKDLCFAISP